MPFFKYKALNREGATYEATIEAADRFVVYRRVKDNGDTIISVTELRSKLSVALSKFNTFFSKVKTHEKIIFARNLAAMIEAGLSVTRALAVMEKQTKNKKLKLVLQELNEDISRGRSLSESMRDKKDVFSTLFVSMVKAGEESGNLAGALKIVGLQMEKSYLLLKKVRGALMYPAVIICIMIIIGVLMLIYMVPTLTATFEGLNIELPKSTQLVIALSDFLRNQYLIAISAVILFIGGALTFSRSKIGKRFFDGFFVRIPIIGNIVKEINAARTARTLSSLLSSGVDIVLAIGVTEEVIQNSFYKDILREAQKAIEKGEPISAVFVKNQKLYPVFVGEMISVGEETGKMADMLLGVATFYEDEVDQKTKDMSSLIEPFLMVFMGIAVGFFAISMLAPTYSLVDAI